MLAKFMNVVMQDGKKSAAERILYGLSTVLPKRPAGRRESLTVLSQALDNVKPAVEVKSRRVGGAPTRCLSKCAPAVARPGMRWVIEAARGRTEKSMAFRIAMN